MNLFLLKLNSYIIPSLTDFQSDGWMELNDLSFVNSVEPDLKIRNLPMFGSYIQHPNVPSSSDRASSIEPKTSLKLLEARNTRKKYEFI